jgi:small-conductance mechanosensitive channel
MMKNVPILFCFLTGFLLVFACKNIDQANTGTSDKLIAEVHNKRLMLSEVQNFIPDNSSAEDSIQIVRAYTERWIKETLLLIEAEKNVPKDLEIDRLVKDYRSSLIITNYEQSLLEQKLDTVVTEDEILQYYEANKEQYLLEHMIIRCRLLKLTHKITPRDKEFTDKNWRSNNRKDLMYLQRVCKEFGEVCYFDENQWHKFDHIRSLLPAGVINEGLVRSNQEFTFKDNQYFFYLKVFDLVSSQELAPLSFIGEQAKKFILHKRKLVLMQQIKEELYEREITGKNVKVHH